MAPRRGSAAPSRRRFVMPHHSSDAPSSRGFALPPRHHSDSQRLSREVVVPLRLVVA